ncbi:MAG: DNA polymerase III subunit alpha [Oligoflexia bacterium]|nr:DNA polymerase III subunit alpha [Oligoflexia bacterium]
MSFVHLHLHSQYSLLDGAIRISDLLKEAKAREMPAVAVTDHGNMFAAIHFYRDARKAGIKPILGSEVYFTDGSRFDRRVNQNSASAKGEVLDSQDENESKHRIYHLILLAKNKTGYQNLCKLISLAYLEGFYYKPRTDIEILKKYSEGLIALSACLKGEIGHNFCIGDDARAIRAIKKFQEIYKDDFYLEIQENGLHEQKVANKKIIAYAKEYSIPLVATNDCHYMKREDALAQEALMCIQTGKTLNDEKRMRLTTNEFYFKSPEEMRRAFHYIPDACDNTLRIADLCNIELKFKDTSGNQIYHLPEFPITTEETEECFFRRITKERLQERFNGPHFRKLKSQVNWESETRQTYLKRLDEEVEMIIKTGFVGYFLVVADFIKWAKDNKIPVGPGRGSGVGSLVAYSIGITNVNPLPYNLLFERFINPERISMPDFDVDFCQDRRNQVIQYVTEKYGIERVGQIITFGKLLAKAVIRDVSRVMSVPYAEADALAKLIPDELGISLEEAIDKEPKLKELEEKDAKVREILSISKRLEGLLRHASIHAAGVVITNKPLVEYAPLFRGKEGEQVVQYDKDFCESIGLVKFDFLGLKTLTVIDEAQKLICKHINSKFDIESIDIEDSNVYNLISSGETIGVFQLESSGMRDLCARLRPDNLEDVTAINALYRPGPLGSGMVDDFVEIKHGRKESKYLFPELKPILENTYGIIVYQEQVMNMARVIAGYTLGQADILRKAMGKKLMDVMEAHREIFRNKAKEKNFDEEKVLELFDLMSKFAEYGFNKSHALAYALIAYQTAYLKYYYPAPFYAALLSTELNNIDKVTLYINDAKLFKVETLGPDVNQSNWRFNVVDTGIRFGLGAIKNVGESAVNDILKERNENGTFKGFVDFCERVNLRTVNKRVMESLIKVGAFDSCEKLNRKTLLFNLDKILSHADAHQKEKSIGQMNLFSMDSSDGAETTASSSMIEICENEEFEFQEQLQHEMELIGIYISGHPLQHFKELLEEITTIKIKDALKLKGTGKRSVVLSGIICNRKILMTKKSQKMAFITLEDLNDKIECVVFPDTYADYEYLLVSDDPLVMEGEINLNEENKKFFPKKIIRLEDEVSSRVSSVSIYLDMNAGSLKDSPEKVIQELKNIITKYKGEIPVTIIFENERGRARMRLGDEYSLKPSLNVISRINKFLSADVVKFVLTAENKMNMLLPPQPLPQSTSIELKQELQQQLKQQQEQLLHNKNYNTLNGYQTTLNMEF